MDLINNCDAETRAGFLDRVGRIKRIYAEMSDRYQASKDRAKNILLK
ncbi:hypothetical protein D3OALGA1CA_5254 [Olavius algarvensis associated proteobacterium Delta 3]|nr:hypothetical protein D3OALGB2SA_545 [Olavius algarvensis associated proteobacterium Delta 3]CAB5164091.1 hypothetical protein D3OALGA1CA_5254 [Olavius algarvensis associated proteobacterium Delta 3]